MSTISLYNPFRRLIVFFEDLSYRKGDLFFQFLSFLIHLLILIPMINFTFQKEVSDIPLILPVEMFIVEEETAAPEFQEEVNEIIPTLQEEVIEEVIEVEETPEITEPVVETLPEVFETEPPIKEIVSEIAEPEISEVDEILVDNSSDQANEFVIEEFPEEKIIEKEEVIPAPIENDFEIKLKEKPEPRETEQPFDNLEIVIKKKPNKKSFNVSTVLKDLENADQEFKKVQEETEVKQEEVFTEKVASTMTISEIDLLRQQLHSCLNLNVGVANLKEIKPVIFIEVNPDRTVKSAKVVNKEKLNDPSFRTAAEAAMRAVNNPDCSPLLLPENKYDQWKEINFTFDFSWMFD
ncbi:hypothetical protein N9E32_02020 [Alphaproteobacteria bacterium]|nr:hypothetical protein [Alphaproteobacteria bacterium]